LEQRPLLPGAALTASPALDFLLDQPGEWLRGTGSKSDVVLSSRIRLARNLAYYRFPSRFSQKDSADTLRVLRSQVAEVQGSAELCYCALHKLNPLERQLFVERQLISRDHAAAEGPRGVFFDRSEKISIMINEEDHLRIQATASGFALAPLLTAAEDYERRIGAGLSFAYNPHFGYATSSLENTGTGLRVSVLLHLPALTLSKQMDKVLRALQKIPFSARGLYGDGSSAEGDLFQITYGVTLGKSEGEIISIVDQIIPQVITYELYARDELLRKSGGDLKDRVDRAYTTLSTATMITAKEATDLLSFVRLGVHMGLLEDLTIPVVNDLFLRIQPAHLQKALRAGPDDEEQNLARAQLLRERLAAKRGQALDGTESM